MKKRTSLGRGLDKLLSTPSFTLANPESDIVLTEKKIDEAQQAGLCYLPLHLIQSGTYQPRQEIDQDALEELAESIRSQGVLQPIVVRPIANNKYEIIAGERRWRAAQIAELNTIPAIIKQASDKNTMAMALIENIQRENLNVMEEANAISRLLNEFEMTHQQIAQTLGKSRVSVTHLLRLLSLTDEVKHFLYRGELDLGHAKVLLGLAAEQQVEAARIIIERSLSVRETEILIKKFKVATTALAQPAEADSYTRHLQLVLTEKLSSKVKIVPSKQGKGKIVIYYNNKKELDKLVDQVSMRNANEVLEA